MFGRMAEWSNAPVLKTGDLRGSGSSNLSPSAIVLKAKKIFYTLIDHKLYYHIQD